MSDINNVVLIGRLCKDPELKVMPSGTSVCQFSVALNRKYKQGDEWKEEVSFIDVKTFGRQADACKEYLGKGDRAGIEGRLEQERWESKDGGGMRSRVVVFAQKIQFLNNKPSGETAPPPDADVPF